MTVVQSYGNPAGTKLVSDVITALTSLNVHLLEDTLPTSSWFPPCVHKFKNHEYKNKMQRWAKNYCTDMKRNRAYVFPGQDATDFRRALVYP